MSVQLFLSHFVVMADQFSGLDTCANRTRKIVKCNLHIFQEIKGTAKNCAFI